MTLCQKGYAAQLAFFHLWWWIDGIKNHCYRFNGMSFQYQFLMKIQAGSPPSAVADRWRMGGLADTWIWLETQRSCSALGLQHGAEGRVLHGVNTRQSLQNMFISSEYTVELPVKVEFDLIFLNYWKEACVSLFSVPAAIASEAEWSWFQLWMELLTWRPLITKQDSSVTAKSLR